MKTVLLRSLAFAGIAFMIVFAIDLLASSANEARPLSYVLAHALFHGAVLIFSFVGATVALVLARGSKLSWVSICAVAVAYGVVTVLVGTGAALLSGKLALVAWLLLGSLSFTLGAALSRKPWRRPAL